MGLNLRRFAEELAKSAKCELPFIGRCDGWIPVVRVERGVRVVKGADLHAAHSCTWLLLDRSRPGRRARCQMAEAICSGVFITWRAEGKPLPSGLRRKKESERAGGRSAGRPEDYIRSTGKRNIERNLIMSTGRARARALSGHIRGQGFYSSSRRGGRERKKIFRQVWKTVTVAVRNAVNRPRVGRWEIIFSGGFFSFESISLK